MKLARAGSVEHRLTLCGGAQTLGILAAGVAVFARAIGLSAACRGDLDLVLEELVTNTFMHGYGPDRQGCIHAAMRQCGGAVEVILCDRAPAFNPLARSTAVVPATLDAASIGGAGIALVRRLTSGGHYRRVAGCNVLILRLRTGKAETG